MPEPRLWQLTAGSAVLGLVLAAGAVATAGPWDSGQRKAERSWAAAQGRTGGAHHEETPSAHRPAPAPSAARVLTALGTWHRGPAGLATTLGPLLNDPGLGPLRTASVVDVTTGERLYGNGDAAPMTPASTIKIATAAAALTVLGPDHRIPTTVVASPDNRSITLVGGGDPTLDRTRLRVLAADTARVLRDRGVTSVRLSHDTSLYTGPALHRVGANDNIAPVSALMLNAGRLDTSTSGPAPRSGDPAGDAAAAFAGALAEAGVSVESASVPGRAPKGTPVARTRSRPLDALVERTLTYSDNDLAEALARQTALATGRPASFQGAGKAVRTTLARLGVPLTGARFTDGSGLDRQNRVSAALLTSLLTRAADPARPELRPVLTGLPVGGFSGTLRTRFDAHSPGAGLVRAKTGTLTGVNALAGTVVTAEGRLLAFAFLAGRTPSPYTAQPALDRLSAALAPNS